MQPVLIPFVIAILAFLMLNVVGPVVAVWSWIRQAPEERVHLRD